MTMKKKRRNTHQEPVNGEQLQQGKRIKMIPGKVTFQNQTLFPSKSQLGKKRRRKVMKKQRKGVGNLACMEKAAIGTVNPHLSEPV